MPLNLFFWFNVQKVKNFRTQAIGKKPNRTLTREGAQLQIQKQRERQTKFQASSGLNYRNFLCIH